MFTLFLKCFSCLCRCGWTRQPPWRQNQSFQSREILCYHTGEMVLWVWSCNCWRDESWLGQAQRSCRHRTWRGWVGVCLQWLQGRTEILFCACEKSQRVCNPKEVMKVLPFFQAQRWHMGMESFGRQWQSGDVVGCMIDLTEMNIMFTLNGEMLISDSGSEMAFKDIEIGEGMCIYISFARIFISDA